MEETEEDDFLNCDE